MTSVGDALLAAGQKQAAYDKYEETRERCLKFHPVRRQLFLLRQPAPLPAVEGEAQPIDVWLDVDVDAQVGDDIRLAAFVAYLDGHPVAPIPSALRMAPGAHELAVEVYLEPSDAGALGGPVRMDVRHPIVVPRSLVGQKSTSGRALVRLRDSRARGSIGDRVTIDTVAPPVAAPDLGPDGPVMLAPNVGGKLLRTDVNQSPHKPRLPPSLNRKGFTVWGLYKVCVDADGAVTWVTTMKSAHSPTLDASWKTAIRTWRYQPHQVDGKPRAFCVPLRLQVTAD
jgi:TonB family protein